MICSKTATKRQNGRFMLLRYLLYNEEVADIRISAGKGEKVLKLLIKKATVQIESELITLFERIEKLIETGLLKDE
jgi:hypothetical protein